MIMKFGIAGACLLAGLLGNEVMHHYFQDDVSMQDLRVVRIAARGTHDERDVMRILPQSQSSEYVKLAKQAWGDDAKIEICAPDVDHNGVFDPWDQADCKAI
ncbi:MAG: hypothetical protein JWN90_426 [Parcubacteria group bacterium]|nr:hypothetical protein [Parcubacteria group bacterium]